MPHHGALVILVLDVLILAQAFKFSSVEECQEVAAFIRSVCSSKVEGTNCGSLTAAATCGRVLVTEDFSSRGMFALSVKKGDVLLITEIGERCGEEWLCGSCGGQAGWIPKRYDCIRLALSVWSIARLAAHNSTRL